MVGPCPSSARGLPTVPAPRLTVLVRHLEPRLGGKSSLPICLQLLAGQVVAPVYQSLRAPDHSSLPPSFLDIPPGAHGRGVYGQRLSTVLRQETGWVGGTFSVVLNLEAQLLHWVESWGITLLPNALWGPRILWLTP